LECALQSQDAPPAGNSCAEKIDRGYLGRILLLTART
jgi:hypothetical protein